MHKKKGIGRKRRKKMEEEENENNNNAKPTGSSRRRKCGRKRMQKKRKRLTLFYFFFFGCAWKNCTHPPRKWVQNEGWSPYFRWPNGSWSLHELNKKVEFFSNMPTFSEDKKVKLVAFKFWGTSQSLNQLLKSTHVNRGKPTVLYLIYILVSYMLVGMGVYNVVLRG